jgi:acyl-CoA synthetase (AMP-forming)/AMP-acid ligase II
VPVIDDPRYDLQCRSIPRALLLTAAKQPDIEAVVDGRERLSYRELRNRSVEAIRAVLAAGIAPGDRVALWAPNGAPWIVAAIGVLGARAVLVPISTRFTGPEVAHVLASSGARLLLAASDSGGIDLIGRLGSGDLPSSVERVVVVQGPDRAAAQPWAEFIAAGSTIAEEAALASIEAISPDDQGDLLFTSGTTGVPKAVPATHGQSLRAHTYLLGVLGARPGDRYLVIPPFFHSFGYKFGWMAGIVLGTTIVTIEKYDAEATMRVIAAERITIMPGPPTLFTDILDHPRRSEYDLSSLRAGTPSAAIVPVEVVKRMSSDLGIDTVLTAYGLTESTATVSTTSPADDPEDIARSVGRAIPGVEVRVRDDDGNVVAAGVAGELEVRGYTVMSGYWNDPVATAAAITPDGWLRTGDIAVIDDRGFITITDRKKDMIISGGMNVYPAEIERVLLRQPGVAAAAVVGVPDARQGEVGMAFLVLREAGDADELAPALRRELAGFKIPRYVEIVDSLPLNTSMKVLKPELRRRAAALLAEPGRVRAFETSPRKAGS